MLATSRYQLIDDLEDAIVNLARQMDATMYGYLQLIREFDERHGWKAYSFTDCAHWLSHRCAMTLQTAHDHVRVARALKDLPRVCAGLADGSLSYSKVRALVRLATPDNEQALVEFAGKLTAATLETRIRELKNGESASIAEANRAHGARTLHRSYGDDGTLKLEVVLPIELGEVVMQAVEKALSAMDEDPRAPHDFFARQADALVDVAKAYVSGTGEAENAVSSADLYQVLVHVDESALRGEGGRSDLPLASVRRLLCDGGVVPVVETQDGEPLSVGRKQRTIPPAIRRALRSRDRQCSFPGCTHERYLDAHHVQHWADGGETSVNNLLLLCTSHHRAVHEGGYQVRRDYQGKVYFMTPRGKVVPACGRYERSDVDLSVVSAESRSDRSGNPSSGVTP